MSSGLPGADSAMKSPSFPQYVHRLGLVLHRCCTLLSTAKSLTYPRRAPPPGLQAGASQWAVTPERDLADEPQNRRLAWDLRHLDTPEGTACSNGVRVYGASYCLERQR